MPINLSYPLDVENDEQQGHYVMFMINEATPGKVSTQIDPAVRASRAAAASKAAGGGGFQDKVFIDEQLNSGSGKSNEQFRGAPEAGGMHMSRPPTTRMAKAITLYMPPSVKVSYKTDYLNPEISGRAALGSELGKGLSEIMSAENWGAAAAAARGAFGPIGESGALVLAENAAATADVVSPGGTVLAQLSAGVILGSKIEVMFKGVGHRQFSFSFNFIPKSEKEAKMVHKIVQTFKEHMLPEYQTFINLGPRPGDTYKIGQGRILRIPDTFDIFYFYHNNENPFLNRISTCYLSDMTIDYGGDKYVTYEPTTLEDGGQEGPPPQKTAISLAFTEIETITRERARDGF